MITTITLNSAIDRTILTASLEYGLVNRINRGEEHIGGKGINVSKVLSQLGTENIASGFLGRDNRAKTEEMMMKDGVKHDFIYLSDDTRTNIVIVEVEKGITTNINEAGFTITEEDFEDVKEKIIEYAKKSEYMVLSGSVPKGIDDMVYHDLISLVNKDTKTLLDADDELLIQGLKASPTIIKPNIHELENAFDVELKTDEDIVKVCRKIIKDYRVEIALISMGGKGSLLVTNTEVYKADPVEVVVKNTVGAGDSMVGGFLHGLSEGLNLDECLRYGSACGTLAVMTPANQILLDNEVKEMLKRVNITRL